MTPVAVFALDWGLQVFERAPLSKQDLPCLYRHGVLVRV